MAPEAKSPPLNIVEPHASLVYVSLKPFNNICLNKLVTDTLKQQQQQKNMTK